LTSEIAVVQERDLYQESFDVFVRHLLHTHGVKCQHSKRCVLAWSWWRITNRLCTLCGSDFFSPPFSVNATSDRPELASDSHSDVFEYRMFKTNNLYRNTKHAKIAKVLLHLITCLHATKTGELTCTVLVTSTATVNAILSKIDRFLEAKAKAMTFCPRAVLEVEDTSRTHPWIHNDKILNTNINKLLNISIRQSDYVNS